MKFLIDLTDTHDWDDILGQFLEVKSAIKQLKDKEEELKAIIMGCVDMESERYTVNVTEFTQTRLESLDAIKEKSKALYETLIENGCVKEVPSTRLTVKPKS